MSELNEALAKIRPHTTSSLAHQKTPATLLHALEATLDEQAAGRSPTAYFAALLTTLDGTLQKEKQRSSGLKLAEGDILPAVLYLLALVAPFAPTPVIRSNLNTILSLAAPLFPVLQHHAPPLRSQLGLFGPVLTALDRAQLDAPAVRQCFASILQLCLDPRPKVRKKAADVVKDVLAAPPPPLQMHPFSDRVAEWAQSTLAEANANAIPRSKHAKSDMESAEVALHLVQLLRTVVRWLPSSFLPPTIPLLLSLPRLGNPFLSQVTYTFISDLLTNPSDADLGQIDVLPEIPKILKAVLSALPPKTDATLAPAWVSLLADTIVAYNAAEPDAASAELPKVWKAVWTFLDSSDASVRRAAAQALARLAGCFTARLTEPAVAEHARNDEEPKSALGKIVAQVDKALDALAYARAMPELLAVIAALVIGLHHRAALGEPTAAEALFLSVVKRIGELRVQKNFEYKEAADAVLGAAMARMGPHVLLEALPLNLEPAGRQAGREPRAFLLPLLAQPHPSPLAHFVAYFVPLSERMFNLQQAAEEAGRAAEAKMWTVLIAQVWAGLPSYCWAPLDLPETLTPAFAQLLSQLLYNQPDLRPPVLRALKTLADASVALSKPDPAAIARHPALSRPDAPSQNQARRNVELLQSQADSWLAVLFNVFGSVAREARGAVGEVIGAWAEIAGEQSIAQAYGKVLALFKQNLSTPAPARGAAPSDAGSTTAMTQDILLILLPHLSPDDASALFELLLSPEVLASADNAVQKRGYKILGKLVEGGKAKFEVSRVLSRLEEVVGKLSSAAKKDRMLFYTALLPHIPPTALHIIPSLIPEAILGTKEPSEKARTAAFDLIVAMGRKMEGGGVVKRDLVEGMDEDDKGEASASVEEYLTMLAAGLAGASPHMISATITAISRVLFEFHGSASEKMLNEILSTMLVFLSSNNREIVKSTLGFTKLAIHMLPETLVRAHLGELIPLLLSRAHDHKNHFKVKVRHILERAIRRFGWEDVSKAAGESEAAKVLVNIKKRKERAKRKRAAAAEASDDDTARPTGRATAGDAFEDVLYGSESEIEDSEDEDAPAQRGRKGTKDFGARLRVDDDEPMDLLAGTAAHITGAQNKRRRRPGQDATHFKTDSATGKLVIADSDSDAAAGERAQEDVVGSAYRAQMTGVDGLTRGPGGRVKFNKDTKKRRREDGDEDVEMEDASAGAAKAEERPGKKRRETRLGHEFRAKKAGGDLKKSGVEPYAYVPLKQAAKKGNRGNRIGVAGKR
ncbi:NUC173-domain-containing protein [Vararia minispora EC-137]|uniref:NUC173-domain-containing protein n=1 Tax=Vararia minispora EC-137 TaxID=1314806 RepID=A0ACB8QCY0_9AGAM|nr:NUC173-domain-containing protein [Vararia minispora EC-137]